MTRALAIAVVAACAHPQQTRVAVRAPEVMHHLDELGRGSAELETTVITKSGRSYPGGRETVFADQTVTVGGRTISLLELLAGCGPFYAKTPCVLAAHGDALIVLRVVDTHEARPEPAAEPRPIATHGENAELRVIAGTLTLASLAGVGICLAVCDEHKAAISISFGAGALLSAVVWAVASGARD